MGLMASLNDDDDCDDDEMVNAAWEARMLNRHMHTTP